MLQHVQNIMIPYVEFQRGQLEDAGKSALVIIDNFKRQVTPSLHAVFEEDNIFFVLNLYPPNTTDLLQPMDIAVNKPAKFS